MLSHHFLFYGPGKVFKDTFIHDFPRDQNEGGWLVVKHQKNQTLQFASPWGQKRKKKNRLQENASVILKNSMEGPYFIVLGY